MLQIALIPDQHDDNVAIRVITEFLEPSGHVDVRGVLGDVVHEERTDGSAVVGGGDGSVAFLTGWREGGHKVTRGSLAGRRRTSEYRAVLMRDSPVSHI